jgi:ketosteroid isomerase-like protein
MRVIPVFLIASAFTALVWSLGRNTKASDPSWQAFLPEFEEALNRFVNGDADLWKQLASRSSDATIMGAWGGYEKGWKEVSARYDWASGRLAKSGAKLNVEYLTTVLAANLAYTVTIERSEVRLVDQDKPSPMALRATQVFRKENGSWKLVHRHADPLIGKTAPATVLQK